MKLKNAARINRACLPENTNPNFEFRYIDISAVGSEGKIAVPLENVKFSAAPSRARRIAPAGSVLVSTVRTYLRAIASVPPSVEPLVFSTGFAVLEPSHGINSRYLEYACRSKWFIEEVVARSVGVSYPAIGPAELGDIPVPVPGIGEQLRIIEFLDRELAATERTTNALREARALLLERRSAGVFDSVTGGHHHDRVLSSLAWAPLLPAAWRSVKLSYVARLGSGHTPSRLRPEWWVDCSIPWVTTGEVSQMRSDRLETLRETREKISEIGLANSAAEIHPRGTVVLCRTAASAGYSAVMGIDMATSQDLATWTCGPELDPFYLLWCLRAMRSDLLERLAFGSTHRTIYMPDLQGMRIPLPPIQEQRSVVEEIRQSNSRIDSCLDAIDRQLGVLDERRQALITAAVTGQIDVTTARGVDV